MTFSAASIDWNDLAIYRKSRGETEFYWRHYWRLTNQEDQMPINLPDKKAYDPAPPGPNQAVCVDVVDHGMVTTSFEGNSRTRPMIDIRWQVNEVDPKTGRRFLVVQRYTLSRDKKSNLMKLLISWRGREFTKEELKTFDVESLIGDNCQLNLVHRVTDDAVYANVASISALMKGIAKIEPLDYMRVRDRPKEGGSQEDVTTDFGGGPDDDIPF